MCDTVASGRFIRCRKMPSRRRLASARHVRQSVGVKCRSVLFGSLIGCADFIKCAHPLSTMPKQRQAHRQHRRRSRGYGRNPPQRPTRVGPEGSADGATLLPGRARDAAVARTHDSFTASRMTLCGNIEARNTQARRDDETQSPCRSVRHPALAGAFGIRASDFNASRGFDGL